MAQTFLLFQYVLYSIQFRTVESSNGLFENFQERGDPVIQTEISQLVSAIASRLPVLLGTSDGAEKMRSFAFMAGPCTETVLLRGKTGVGKNFLAKCIHAIGLGDRPFIAVNCGATTETLLESELFGHEKGAFTGAHIRKQGLIEKANGGTLFLSEIGNMSTMFQAKLLDFLDQEPIRRVGGTEEIQVNARIIAATNLDLEEAIEKGTFRSDLYYRLNVLPFFVPTLSERKEDIPLLTKHFTRRRVTEFPVSFGPGVMAGMMDYSWPGNVRELRSAVRRALVMSNNGDVAEEHVLPFLQEVGLGSRSRRVGAPEVSLSEAELVYRNPENGEFLTLSEFKRLTETEYIKKVLVECGGSLTRAKTVMKTPRSNIYKRLEDYQLTDFYRQCKEGVRTKDS